jgi:hypothetical protein
MTIRRTLATASATLLLLASLTACFGAPAADTSGLSGTSWSGTDSDGDAWGIDFQGDGTIGLDYNGKTFDDASDTWVVSGGNVAIHVAFGDGDVDLAGAVAADAMDLTGTYGEGGTFTLTLTKD